MALKAREASGIRQTWERRFRKGKGFSHTLLYRCSLCVPDIIAGTTYHGDFKLHLFKGSVKKPRMTDTRRLHFQTKCFQSLEFFHLSKQNHFNLYYAERVLYIINLELHH